LRGKAPIFELLSGTEYGWILRAYPAMGTKVRSELAIALGAAHTRDGLLNVDDKQRTTVEGLYGVGDVVSDLHQVSVALGHAAIAACNIHNSLPRSFAK
jgi:thioredoxin reductase (NADPH)